LCAHRCVCRRLREARCEAAPVLRASERAHGCRWVSARPTGADPPKRIGADAHLMCTTLAILAPQRIVTVALSLATISPTSVAGGPVSHPQRFDAPSDVEFVLRCDGARPDAAREASC
jgi:hypothetical protein